VNTRIAQCFSLVAAASLALCTSCETVRPAAATGLSVRNGVLTLNGKPYRGIGVNYFSLFSRTLEDPADRSYEAELKRLADADIPFVRFMACGFWPVDWDLYFTDRPAYFARLDAIVRCAEANGVGLIPSLFWHMSTVPDLMGEPIDQYGNPSSKTAAFLRQYTREVVSRYRDSPAIWGWEFGNEYALAADLPNAAQHRPPVWPKLKTALQRSSRDELTAAALSTALGIFAETVRSLDPHRILSTGNALPRFCAYHNTFEKSWNADTPEQFVSVLLRDNPPPFDTFCVHVYPNAKGVYPGGAATLRELISRLQQLSSKHAKPLFIGEFGAPATLPEQEERARFGELLTSIERSGVPLAALWVYDLSQQDKDWNVTFSNRRVYMLESIAAANRRMRGG